MSSNFSWEEARDHLRKLREEQSRKSAEVIDLWESIVSDARYKLGDDLWPIYEQVCIAACDCGRDDISIDCIHALQQQFPSSLRVKMLHGMYLESINKYDEALEIYEEIQKDDSTNTVALKRKVSIFRSMNKIKEAISTLNQYLKDYMADFDSWNELCDLYLLEQDYYKAAFCMEECIMSNPHNHAYYEKYAQIKYTAGGVENMETARKYFSQALKLHHNNMRALYGLFMSASNLASVSKTGKKENIRYAEWASKEIGARYKDKSSVTQKTPSLAEVASGSHSSSSKSDQKQLDIVQSMLEGLRVTTQS